VQVEVQLANGLPSFTLVGLADTEVKESRERVRAALQQSGLCLPAQQAHHRQPGAGRPAQGDRAASTCRSRWASWRPMARSTRPRWRPANLPASCRWPASCARCAARWRWRWRCAAPARGRTLVLPTASAAEAALVPGLEGARRRTTWLAVVQRCCPATAKPLPRPSPRRACRHRGAPRPARRERPGRGQARAGDRRGRRHSLLLVGPPGTGKSMLAQRLPGLLPPMDEDEALASAALPAWPGGLRPRPAGGQRPVRAPHHTASAVALVGGGSPPRPGEISLAHGGVLFLDERRSSRARAGGPARAAGDRPHHHLARRAAGAVSRRASSWWRR
jgi:magnesium chelatase family protein